MSEPTYTRTELRRAVAKAQRMEFFRRYDDGEVSLTGTPTTTSLASTSLTQADNHWRNGWAFLASGTYVGEERRITAFTASSDSLTLEYALAGAPAAGDKLEIFDMWPPSLVHEAINRAIEHDGRLFPETVVDRTLVLEQDKLRYTLTGLSKRVRHIYKVQMERFDGSQTDILTAVTADGANLQLAAAIFDEADEYNGWTVVIYDGTGSGSIGTIDDTVDGYAVVTTADFTVAPAANSKIRIFDSTYQTCDFRDVNFRYLDTAEYPDTLYIEGNFTDYYGFKLAIFYTSLPAPLTAEASTTVVPKELVVTRAGAYLHEDTARDNRADASRHLQMAQYLHARADDFSLRYYNSRPSPIQSFQGNLGSSTEVDDPLGWRQL